MNNNIISSAGNITMISDAGIQYSTSHWLRPRDTSGNMHLKADSGGIYLDAGIIHFRNAAGGGDTTITGGVYSGNISGNATTATNFNNGSAYSSGGVVYVDTLESISGADWLELVYYGGVGVRIGTGVNGSKALYAGSLYDAGNRVYSAGNPQVNISGSAGYSDYVAAQTNPVGNFNVGLSRPKGASYTTTASVVTGAIKIKLPPGTPVHGMWKMTVKIYEYGQRGNGYTIELGCHLYPSTAYNRYQWMLTTDTGAVLPIRYGTDGSSGCVWIGENGTTWSYPQVHVTEFSNGFNNPGGVNWTSGTWAVSIGAIDNSVAVDGPYTTSLIAAAYASTAGSATSASYADSIYWSGNQRLYGGSDGTRNTGWAYHNNNGTGLHWPNNGWHLYPINASDFYIRSGASDCSLKFTKSGTSGSYVHCSAANEIGFLTTGRSWSVRVDDSGNSYTAGDVTAYSSDRRLKDNIINIPNSLEKVMSLNGVTFDWNDTAINSGFSPTVRYNDSGVIAQEVQKVLPQAVKPAPFDRGMDGLSKSGQNYLTVQYEKIVPILIEAIKEQQSQIEDLKNKLNEFIIKG